MTDSEVEVTTSQAGEEDVVLSSHVVEPVTASAVALEVTLGHPQAELDGVTASAGELLGAP